MKKLIALLLALLMVSSAVIAVSAEEETLTAPKIFAQTEPVKTAGTDGELGTADDETTGYNVRFLAGVSNTNGTEIGFSKVVAKFYDTTTKAVKAVEYTAEEFKGNTIYQNIYVNGKSQTVAEATKDSTLIGLFPAGINGVPADIINVTFEIVAYVTDGTDTKSTTATAEFLKGEFANITYSQNFDNVTDLAAAGVSHPYVNDTCATGGLPMSINTAGKLQISAHDWHSNPDYFAHLVSADEVNAADIYKFEADVSISSIASGGAFSFILNNDYYEPAPTKNPANQYLSDALIARIYLKQVDTTSYVYEFRVQEYMTDGSNVVSVNGTQQNSWYRVYDRGYGNPIATDFKLTMIVDSTDTEEGCKLYLYLDGVLVGTLVCSDTYDVDDASAIGIWAQGTDVTIDNIKFSGVGTKKNS